METGYFNEHRTCWPQVGWEVKLPPLRVSQGASNVLTDSRLEIFVRPSPTNHLHLWRHSRKGWVSPSVLNNWKPDKIVEKRFLGKKKIYWERGSRTEISGKGETNVSRPAAPASCLRWVFRLHRAVGGGQAWRTGLLSARAKETEPGILGKPRELPAQSEPLHWGGHSMQVWRGPPSDPEYDRQMLVKLPWPRKERLGSSRGSVTGAHSGWK